MRLSNRKRQGFFEFIPTFLVILALACVAFYFFDKNRFRILGNEKFLLWVTPIFLLGVFYFRGRQIFEYDSDGEALNFKNRNVIGFLGKTANDEFPKYKLQKFEVLNLWVYKRLYITISSKKSHSVILKYDISYVPDKDIRDLKISLNKVLKTNKESI